MIRSVLLALAPLALLGAATLPCACTGDESAAGTGGSSATTSFTGECHQATDCPGVDSSCAYRVCGFGLCDMIYAPATTLCDEDGGVACDGSGRCVACLSPAECPGGVCQDGQCVAAHCDDHLKDGDETDVDCGGGCNPCGTGRACLGSSDCASAVCVNNTCAAPSCGDQHTNGSEACDDGNDAGYDGCYACRADAGHPMLSEIVAAPTEAEFVEIYNPGPGTLALEQIWLADYAGYYAVTTGSSPPSSSDFRVHFPAGASLAPGAFAVVSLHGAAAFTGAYGQAPNFDLDPTDPGAPTMLGSYGAGSGLTNGAEMVVLFRWDGVQPLVTDLDYVVYGDTTNAADKSGVAVGGTGYLADTPAAQQSAAPAPASGSALHRCDTSEGSEKSSGGNGTSGDDETSENLAATWQAGARTPGAAPPVAACPH